MHTTTDNALCNKSLHVLAGPAAASAAFLSALFLSLLCGLFYNVWKYDVERIVREEGSFHGKISGKFGDKELEWIQNFGGVSKTRVGEGTGETTLVELWFYPPRAVFY